MIMRCIIASMEPVNICVAFLIIFSVPLTFLLFFFSTIRILLSIFIRNLLLLRYTYSHGTVLKKALNLIRKNPTIFFKS